MASGTATLEAALLQVLMVVIYRASWPTYLAARAVMRVPHIAMVNVVTQKAVVPEFVQHRATPKRIADATVELLRNDERATAMGLKQTGVPAGGVVAALVAPSLVLLVGWRWSLAGLGIMNLFFGFFFWAVVIMAQEVGNAELLPPFIAGLGPAGLFALASLWGLRRARAI